MQDLKEFTSGGYGSGDIRTEQYLETKIQEYIESNTVMKNYCEMYPIPATYPSAVIPTIEKTGSAGTISEGTEIPTFTMTSGSFTVKVEEYGTAAEVTDEARMTDWLGITGQRTVIEAGRQMVRKENADIMAILLAGAGTIMPASTTNSFKYEDIVAMETAFENKNMHGDTCFIAPDQKADILLDDRFINYSRSNTTDTLREGTIGRISSCNIVVIPEMPSGTAIMMDSSLAPLWFVTKQNLTIENYRLPKTGITGFTVRAWGKPAVTRSDAIIKLINC